MNKALKITLGILITFLVLMLSSILGIELTSIVDFLPIGFSIQFINLLFSSILIYFFNKKGIIDFNIGRVKANQIIYPILLPVLLVILNVSVIMLRGDERQPVVDSMSNMQIFFIIVLLASLSEELLFRGFLQNMLDPIKSLGIRVFKIKLSLPVIIGGILFGLMHFGMMSMGASFDFVIQVVITATIMGMIAGYYQEKYNNFSYPIIVHVTSNLTGLLISIIAG
jgi:membrane protease YdiL (CAAX protease family)